MDEFVWRAALLRVAGRSAQNWKSDQRTAIFRRWRGNFAAALRI
jgi:hypothetical protein